MKSGDLVKLIYPQGKDIPFGMVAEVVPHNYFPKYYQEMIDEVGKECVDEEFIAVEWLGHGNFKNGFYLKHRFTEFQTESLLK